MQPSNDFSLVRRLAAEESTCAFYPDVLAELARRNWDTDELRALVEYELGETHCHKTSPTTKHHPGTQSDYFRIWVDEFGCLMFLKLLVSLDGLLWVTSFRREDQL